MFLVLKMFLVYHAMTGFYSDLSEICNCFFVFCFFLHELCVGFGQHNAFDHLYQLVVCG